MYFVKSRSFSKGLLLNPLPFSVPVVEESLAFLPLIELGLSLPDSLAFSEVVRNLSKTFWTGPELMISSPRLPTL
ncbi:hypothetical protein D3C87_2097360 [compost metagenome]